LAELKAVRDQSREDADSAESVLENAGATVTPHRLPHSPGRRAEKCAARPAGYRRDHLRALAQRVEVDEREVRIMGSKGTLLRTLGDAQAGKRRVLGCPVLFRSGAPKRIKERTFRGGPSC